MNDGKRTTEDVFGISRDVPLNYVERPNVDTSFVENLTRERHLIIYGSSKQGKTCLRKNCLDENDHTTVHCSNKWSLGDLHAAILKAAGYEVTQSTKKSASGQFKVSVNLAGKLFGAGVEGTTEGGGSRGSETNTSPLELDVDDVNDIIGALKGINFSEFVVLEDFHYLSVETQRDFAVALKAFHEASDFCFIIVGVWLEENRMIVYNGDLTGRIVAINADAWPSAQLREVVTAGEYLLNVKFDESYVKSLVDGSAESVYIVQEACYRTCKQNKVNDTLDQTKTIGDGVDVEQLIKDVVDEQSGRYNSFLTQFADGFQKTELEMYRWLLYPVLTATPSELDEGLRVA